MIDEEDDDSGKLPRYPADLEFCVQCGKKSEKGSGDYCVCEKAHLRKITFFIANVPMKNTEKIYKSEKKTLSACPNCDARNTSGLEPVRRFQESEDETGLAMAIPLSHFQVTPKKSSDRSRANCSALPTIAKEPPRFPRFWKKKLLRTIWGSKIVRNF